MIDCLLGRLSLYMKKGEQDLSSASIHSESAQTRSSPAHEQDLPSASMRSEGTQTIFMLLVHITLELTPKENPQSKLSK